MLRTIILWTSVIYLENIDCYWLQTFLTWSSLTYFSFWYWLPWVTYLNTYIKSNYMLFGVIIGMIVWVRWVEEREDGFSSFKCLLEHPMSCYLMSPVSCYFACIYPFTFPILSLCPSSAITPFFSSFLLRLFAELLCSLFILSQFFCSHYLQNHLTPILIYSLPFPNCDTTPL